MTGKAHIEIPKEKIAGFCRKWKIREFTLSIWKLSSGRFLGAMWISSAAKELKQAEIIYGETLYWTLQRRNQWEKL